jgi:hypothetical protein
MRTYEDGIDVSGMYEYVPSAEGDEMHIRIAKGDWKDVVYRYGKVGFKPDEGDDNSDADERLTLAFEYDIITLPQHLENKEVDDEDYYAFENLVGDILVDLIEHDLESKNKDDETRTTDIKTPVSE